MSSTAASMSLATEAYIANNVNGVVVSASAGGFVPDGRVRKWRRPSVAVERSRLLVAGSVSEGSVLAPRVSVWLEAVAWVVEVEGLRSDHAARGMGVARALVSWVDGGSRTTRVTNEGVRAWLERAGVAVSVRTVQRWLRRFEAWGLLGLVAQGRSARWAPLKRVQEPGGGVRLERVNEAAVRSLTVPVRVLAEMVEAGVCARPAAAGGVGESQGCGSRCHPYPWLGIDDPRTRARGGPGMRDEVPLRGAEGSSGAASRPPGGLRGDRRPAWWSSRPTRSTEEAAVGLARSLQDEWVVLRGCSDRYVMRVIRPFFDAGWGRSDLVWAVDRRPDGGLWPHSGARGVREPARWLIHRLSAWLDEAGAPLVAPSMVARAQHERVLAARRAEARARLAEAERIAAERAGFPGGVGPGQARARAVAAALGRRAASQRRWRRQWAPR